MELGFLTPVLDTPGPWATVWCDTSYAAGTARQRELAARGAGERIGALGADEATREAVHRALARAPDPGGLGARTGRFLLAAHGKVACDLALAGSPSRAVEAWSALPRLAPLVDGLAGGTPCLVACLDRTGADLELRDGGTARAVAHAEGSGERTGLRVARVIARVWPDSGARLLLLAGAARERRAVRDRLPAAIAERCAESEHGGRGAGTATALLDRDVAAARAGFEREWTAADLARYRAAATPVVEDVQSLVTAAREHRIDTLFIHPRGQEAGHQVWAGPRPDQLAARIWELQFLGGTRPEPVRADDALLRSAVTSGAAVVVVPDPAEAPVGGLGALLRSATDAPSG